MNGTIKFYKPEGWGKVNIEGQTRDMYFNLQSVEGELRTLLDCDRYINEPVVFEVGESSRKPGEKEAKSMKLDITKRCVGYVNSYDPEKGYGFLENYHSKESIFFHFSAIRKDKGREDKFVKIENGEPVIFTEDKNDKGKKNAVDLVKIDDRTYIEEFAIFSHFRQSLTELRDLAETENWDYIKKPTKGIPVLFSYLNQTCIRLVNQNKIVRGRSTKDAKEYAWFNTGLVTPQQDEIFAYFVKNSRYKPLDGWGVQIPEWSFLEFNTEQSVYRRYFIDIPEIATYFSEAEVSDLIFDTRTPIIPDKEHLLKRKGRFESERVRSLDDEAFIEEIKDAIELAKKRIRRNYKTAIPHFYDNSIQYLIPLCFRANKAEALGALVVSKDENIHKAHTILSLDQAYNNARLLAKPDREWLNP